jgi:tetratricopeptide (TPR) repeat protein
MRDLRRATEHLVNMAVLTALTLVLTGCPSTNNLYGQAYSHFTQREEEKALELLARIIAQDARYTPAYVLQSTIYETRGDWSGAEQSLRAAEDKAPPSPVVSFNLGNIYFKKGDYGRAVEQYSRAVNLNPVFIEAYINRANARMQLKDYPAALADYEKFLALTGKEYPNVRDLVKLLRRDLGLGPVDLRK